MRRGSTDAGALLVAVLAGLVGVAACDGGVSISLQLRTAANSDPVADASGLRSLTVIIDNGESNERSTLELDRAAQIPLPPLSVDRNQPFHIEVWGCNRSLCEEADVILRGCTTEPIDVAQSDDTETVTMLMYDFRDDVLGQCPGLSG
jgi:hypothetical protein